MMTLIFMATLLSRLAPAPILTHGLCLDSALVRRELIHRRLRIRLPRPQDRRGEVRMVHRVREVLRLQAERAVLLVRDTSPPLQLAVQEVARVELHTRLGGGH